MIKLYATKVNNFNTLWMGYPDGNVEILGFDGKSKRSSFLPEDFTDPIYNFIFIGAL